MIPIESQAQTQKTSSGKEEIAHHMTLKFKPVLTSQCVGMDILCWKFNKGRKIS